MGNIPERPLQNGTPKRPDVYLRQLHRVDSTFHHRDVIPSTRQRSPSVSAHDLQLELSSLLDPIVAKPNRRLGPYPSAADSVPSETDRERGPVNCCV